MEWLRTIGPFEFVILVPILILSFIPAAIAYQIAKRKHLPPGQWTLLAIVFSWPIVVALLFFPTPCPRDS